MSNAEIWHADILITEELVKECIQEQFSSLMPIKEFKQIGEGWDNKVFLVNGKIIFRFPRRKVAVELIEQENNILNHLPALPEVATPRPKYIGQSTSYYPYPFQGYDLIPGVPGYLVQFSIQDRRASIKTLAKFLKQLHSISAGQAYDMGVKPQMFDRTVVEERIANLTERVAKIIARDLFKINLTGFEHEVMVARDIVLPTNDECLVHGDLDCRHLLFNGKHLTGIIDWGDAGVNNRAVDFDVVWSFYPSSCHEQFFEYYGEVDSVTWQYARFLGLYTTLSLLLYGSDVGDTQLVTEMVHATKRINADLLMVC